MAHHVIVGAGPIGSALATLLASRGERVDVVTRSGRGPDGDGITLVRADASDPATLDNRCQGADVLYNCANPGTYMQWEDQWPPLAASLLHAAEHSGAVLVTLSNLYGYGPVDVPLSTDLPLAATGHKGRLRAGMWRDALAAHEAGRIRTTEVRASDYIGPRVTAAGGLLRRYAHSALRGRTAWVFGDPDATHSWTYADDAALTLATVATDERAWGAAWHVPSAPPRTVREVLTDLLAEAQSAESAQPARSTQPGARPAPTPRIRRVPRGVLSAIAPVVPIVRELGEVLWQFERPFVIDAAPTTELFGLTPTPWPEVVARTAAAWSA